MRSILLFGVLLISVQAQPCAAAILQAGAAATPQAGSAATPQAGSAATPQAGADPFAMIHPRSEALTPLPFSAVKPLGWLKAQIEENLKGFTGHLDSLCPDLVVTDDIYGKDRLTRRIRKKEVGAFSDNDAAQVQYLWWNSETQSNWWDGLIRSAILTGDPATLAKVSVYVRRILGTQDSDGYLGIYDRDLRYHFRDENGELWSKTTLLRGLLAWYEYTRNQAVLHAVERAVDNLMKGYPADTSRPFYSIHPNVGGLSHGLVLTDVLETLHRLTGKGAYRAYCVFLYKNFSEEVLNEDAQYAKLMDTTCQLKGHGVHTYEHIRAVAAAAYASGNPLLGEALQRFLVKVSREINPSGGPAGDEWIGGRGADPTHTGYEYCSLQELMNAYTDLMAKTGKAAWGDGAERLFFNAAQGARNPDYSCIAYLKTDNSYYMTGPQNGDTSQHHQTRYSYSPVHQDAAVCCVPNAGRIAPYYTQNMWMRNSQGLVATLLGPSVIRTTWKRTSVQVTENTSYPYGMEVAFVVDKAPAGLFTLSIRKPSWAVSPKVWVNGAASGNANGISVHRLSSVQEKDGYILIRRVWKKGDKVRLLLDPTMQVAKDEKGQPYFTYGPLVLAHPISSSYTITKNYPLVGFHDYSYRPDSLTHYLYKGGGYGASTQVGEAGAPMQVGKAGAPKLVKEAGSFRSPALVLPALHATMVDAGSGKEVLVSLVPMGGTILRQVTF
jgi:DUF1680 family protein